MDVRELAELETRRMTAFFLNFIRNTPADRMEWAPEGGRTILEQFREVAQATAWSAQILETQETMHWGLREVVRARRERDQWDAAECERQLATNTERLLNAMRAFPTEKLRDEIEIPVHGRICFAQVLGLQVYHLSYHAGQIGYLQTLYGDAEMPTPF
jgi:hypothetical protein